MTKSEKAQPPVHPREVLVGEFLAPLALSQYRLAKALGVPPRRVDEIVMAGARFPPTGLAPRPIFRAGAAVLVELAIALRS
jgi:hypothetical protein